MTVWFCHLLAIGRFGGWCVHQIELVGCGEVHCLDDAVYAFAVAKPPLDFVHPSVVDGLMGRRVRDLREAQFRHPSEQKSLVFRDELRKTCYDFVINGIKVAVIL